MALKFSPSAVWRGVFAGSGSDGLSQKCVVDEIVRLTNKQPKEIKLSYFGTATYDLSTPRQRQTAIFENIGCHVRDESLADPTIPVNFEHVKNHVQDADVIIVSGGNTLYAIDRWKQFGVDKLLLEARDRGCVLAGGSAGAICWFDGGHSDSMDPDTFRTAMMRENLQILADESSNAPQSKEDIKDWKYIRVSCLGLFPGLVCPHYDKVQSNGILRAIDFEKMMLKHAGENALGIDHWAALVIEGERYRVLSLRDKPGSLMPDSSFSPTAEGIPWIWRKVVIDGGTKISSKPIAEKGLLTDILQQSQNIVPDPLEQQCRELNPSQQQI